MRDYGLYGVLAAIVVILIAVFTGTFTVQQTEQALVLRFGQPVAGRGLVSDPGLHFKIPLIETVVLRSNQILNLETPNQDVFASDNKRLQVDAFLRYKIVDLLKFYQSLQTKERAESQLGSLLNSTIREVLATADLTQIVRDQRAELMEKIKVDLDRETEKFGIASIDVRIRRADLPQQISEQVYKRMESERDLTAAQITAKGKEAAQKITADADRQVVVLLGDAQQKADTIRGDGEAQRIKIFADAYNKDPEFFAFYRLMNANDEAFKGSNTRLVLTPDKTNEFFRYFKSPNLTSQAGGKAGAAAATPDGSAPAQPSSSPSSAAGQSALPEAPRPMAGQPAPSQ